MSFNDWLEHVLEAGMSTTMDNLRDPSEILDELEHRIIDEFGCNLNGITIHYGDLK